ncbi:MAG: Ig-like domain-containing protein [Rubrivivax sp.]|nr:Ig-like domain-containing protein [Rubrivivax sp.]
MLATRAFSLVLPAVAGALAVAATSAHAAAAVGVRFDPTAPAGVIFPNDRWTVPDWSQVTLRRIALPKPDCAQRPNDCADIDVLNTLDGFSTQPRITVPFSGDIDPASVDSHSVFLVNLGDTLTLAGFGRKVGINQVVWDVASRRLAFTSDELLDEHARYLVVVTDGVRDATGRPIEVLRPNGSANAEAERQREQAARLHQGRAHRVVAAALFTTQSVSVDLLKALVRIKLTPPAPVDMLAASMGGVPVRSLFPVSSLSSVQFVRQTGTAPAFAAPATLNLALLSSVAQIAYGRFSSPDYQAEPAFIAAAPTLTGAPQVRRINQLVFQLLVPAGPQPPAGWPVAIFGHGGNSTIHNGSVWRLGAELAAQGVASIALHAVGHGGGPLGTVNVLRTDGTGAVVDAGGRGVDANGDGSIGTNEGSRAVAPRELIGNRDAQRQTAIDQMQLVRQIEAGLDVDGDGRPDLDASRIYIAAQSFGASHGTILLALDPGVRAGVLNVPGGSAVEAVRLGAARPAMGAGFAARVPSLINVGGTTFDEAIPLRNVAPLVNTAAGAFALAENIDWQQWAQQSGNPVAYARFIRRAPLPGQAAKPVILQIAKGDQTHPNPASTAILRAGDLADRATYYRHDLGFAANPTALKDPHTFLTTANAALQPIGLAALRQMALFFASHGATTVDPDGDAALFETPIVLPLPETLNFIP